MSFEFHLNGLGSNKVNQILEIQFNELFKVDINGIKVSYFIFSLRVKNRATKMFNKKK